ncbi:membrane protein [Stenotrophomonas ginsengisoli]|uniref:Ancillary SecYEG translocon subunit n=1 Tax=Stenotrophomonas ginsengisoli TaxID=336566 RepID=A0A0R0CWY2_9GAMM|nr:tetratricopeptide repeat protein [Stenotrophomonas ginsengisoli]KRG74297.1 membrane protein [Stenotrophomonas ginsengisoli]
MAIDDLLDEHEQGQRVQDWLRRNGLSILGGVALGIAAIWGWQNWQSSRLNSSAADNARYQAVVDQLASSDLDEAARQVKALESESNGIYVDLAALALVKAQVDAGKVEEAIGVLRELKAEGEFKSLVDQRIARLLIESGKPAEAITTLAAATDATSLEIIGDAHVAGGDADKAREVYARALEGLKDDAPQRGLLETKLSDVGGEVPANDDATA